MSVKNIKLINQRIALENVIFVKKAFLQPSLKVVVKDEIGEIKINNQDISFVFKRKATLDPISVFEVDVCISYSSRISDDSYKLMLDDKKTLVHDDLVKIINNTNIPQTASMIISNLTAVNGGNPLITAPVFVK